MVTVRWLGVAGLEFTSQGKTLLIDPYLSRPTKLRSLLHPLVPDTDRIDDYLAGVNGRIIGIGLGHTHSDHALDIPYLAKKLNVPVYGSESARNLLAIHDADAAAVIVQEGNPYQVGPFVITPILSRHGRIIFGKVPFPGDINQNKRPPLRIHHFRHGTVYSWLIEIDGQRYLHLSSADFIPEELEGLKVDVLFPCSAGRQNTPEFTKRIIDLVRPKVVVPFHFDDFSAPFGGNHLLPHVPGVNLLDFVDDIRYWAPDARVVIPEPFLPMEF